jgi:glucose dehydrogenase
MRCGPARRQAVQVGVEAQVARTLRSRSSDICWNTTPMWRSARDAAAQRTAGGGHVAFVGREQPGQHLEQRALAGAVGPQQRDELPSEELGHAGWSATSKTQRYSTLNQINKKNVGKMQVAWTFSTGVLRGHEGSPLVVDGKMYLHSPFPNKVFAIDLDTQKIKWKYEPKQDPAVIPQMCCDTVNRGLAYAEGKVILQQADTT